MSRARIAIPFSKEQQEMLAANPFTLSVNDYQIRFTLEFKKYLLAERERNGTPWKEVFRKAGYDPKVLGKGRIDGIVQTVRKEAASETGLHETAPKKTKASENPEKQRMQTAIRELREEVEILKQQIEFLKKTRAVRMMEEDDG